MRPAEFIRPKETKILPCERRFLVQLGMGGENGPYPRATQLSLSEILLGDGAQQVRVQGIRRIGLVDLLLGGGVSQASGRVGGGCDPLPRTTQVILYQILPLIWQDEAATGSQASGASGSTMRGKRQLGSRK